MDHQVIVRESRNRTIEAEVEKRRVINDIEKVVE
jgi:hypothetical protein